MQAPSEVTPDTTEYLGFQSQRIIINVIDRMRGGNQYEYKTKRRPMKRKVKFFQIIANDRYLFGLDQDGRVWGKCILSEISDWILISSPETEMEPLE